MKYSKGQKFEITKTLAFGKEVTEVITIVAIHPWNKKILFDNGLELYAEQL